MTSPSDACDVSPLPRPAAASSEPPPEALPSSLVPEHPTQRVLVPEPRIVESTMPSAAPITTLPPGTSSLTPDGASADLGSMLPRPSLVPSIEPVQSFPEQSLPIEQTSELERELTRRLRTGRAALPVLPQVAEAALRLANDPEARIDELSRLVDTDPPIAARFMSVANSVAYWRGWLTASTQSAIVRLGLANTRDLLFQVVYAASASGLKKFQTPVQNSFKRSVVAAVAARIAARELGVAGEYDYMCGLLHDIGEARVYRILDGMTIAPKDRELVKTLVRKYHCVAGAEVAMAWKLPTEIVDACAAHHDENAVGTPHVRLVMIADVIVEALELSAQGKSFPTKRFEKLGIEFDLARELVDKTRTGVSQQKPR